MNDFGERLKKTMKETGYTQVKVTEELELSKNAITNYVKGRIPDATILYRLSRLLGVSMEWLLTGINFENTKKNIDISNEITSEELRIIELFRQLSDREKIKIEGIIENKISESQEFKKGKLSTSQNGKTDISERKNA